METTFTKGPWIIPSKSGLMVVGNLILPDNASPYRPGICSLGFRSNGTYISMPLEERESNAYLISAAPELLEALESFVDSCYTGCTKEQLEELRIKGEAAISKALNR